MGSTVGVLATRPTGVEPVGRDPAALIRSSRGSLSEADPGSVVEPCPLDIPTFDFLFGLWDLLDEELGEVGVGD